MTTKTRGLAAFLHLNIWSVVHFGAPQKLGPNGNFITYLSKSYYLRTNNYVFIDY